MERSQAFLRIHFLTALRNASAPIRYQMIENITPGQMGAITEVAYHVVNTIIPTLMVDRDYFRRYRLVLRILASQRTSFNVKRRVLLRRNSSTIIPRLLSTFYLSRTIRFIARSREE